MFGSSEDAAPCSSVTVLKSTATPSTSAETQPTLQTSAASSLHANMHQPDTNAATSIKKTRQAWSDEQTAELRKYFHSHILEHKSLKKHEIVDFLKKTKVSFRGRDWRAIKTKVWNDKH